MIDWLFATQIAGFGFLTVFVVLGILALVLWLVSLVIYRIIGKQGKENKRRVVKV